MIGFLREGARVNLRFLRCLLGEAAFSREELIRVEEGFEGNSPSTSVALTLTPRASEASSEGGGSDASFVDVIVCKLHTKFVIKDLGALSLFCGIEVCPTLSGLLLSQQKYVIDLLSKHHMLDSKPVSTLIVASSRLTLHDESLFFDVTKLEGKVAVITGGASGIGEATVKLFVRHGARVIVADVQDEKGKTLCAGLGSDDVASYVHCDVRLESDVMRAVDTAISLHGKLDIMFNNAGIVDPSGSSILGEDDTTAVFDRVMGVNVLGALLGTKHAGRAMVAAGRGGSIIITASLASVVGALGHPVYSCSKHAVLGLARSAAAELGKNGVRVNCVSPSVVATQMTVSLFQANEEELEALGEMISALKGVTLKAEDIAEAALFLASDESRFLQSRDCIGRNGMRHEGAEMVKGLWMASSQRWQSLACRRYGVLLASEKGEGEGRLEEAVCVQQEEVMAG
ncbi:hypothetical protein ZIOFF_001031 [Zingiber officinale]|uniref:Uncharacterized protein n=1 Tax=Zingiber officinale TaxID=94328 RepID=A0A8J5LRS3_ZINOF|nr:hypothetical protein ZIOFF_001031 [Zingiber officinale]